MLQYEAWGINLKFKIFKAIRFNLWATFFIFSVIILLLFGLFQIVLIKPYYRNNKQISVTQLANDIKQKLLKSEYLNNFDLENTNNKILNNNVCIVIYNEKEDVVYNYDSLGDACMYKRNFEIKNKIIDLSLKPNPLIKMIKEKNDDLSISYHLKNINKDMLIYGFKYQVPYENFYLFINSPLEPFDIYVNFIVKQYFYLILVCVFVALFFAFLIANKFSKPLIQMKNSAKQLAEGNYKKAYFKKGPYNEYEILANTLNDATFKLSKIDELRKDLIANVSHDIKTPLTMIEAYAEMIRDISGDDKEKRQQHLKVILDETKYLDKLVDDISLLSKIQSGFIELNKRNFDLKEKILEIIKGYEVLMNERKIKLELSLTNVTIYADELKISQVINNYLSNAVKYTKENSIIRINIIDKEDYVRFEIIDEGEGIRLEDQPYIWDRYYKIDKKFSRNIYQSGLGLAIVKAIITAHNGKYGVNSKEGKGSKFYFEISKNYE